MRPKGVALIGRSGAADDLGRLRTIYLGAHPQDQADGPAGNIASTEEKLLVLPREASTTMISVHPPSKYAHVGTYERVKRSSLLAVALIKISFGPLPCGFKLV
jgi:hypothetical protein